jgi:hypothetical protein
MSDPLASHILAVDALRNVGVEPPEAWLEVRARFATVTMNLDSSPMLTRLVDAVLHGGGDIPALYAAALAETDWQHRDAVLTPLRHRVAGRLIELHRPHAAKAYTAVSNRFNDVATAFTNASRTIDPEAASDEVIGMDTKTQKAWRDAPGFCATMNDLVDALCAGAVLAGAPGDYGDMSFDKTTLALPLTVANLGSLHRRRVWQAFADLDDEPHQPGVITTSTMTAPPRPARRCGRWSRLIALGAKIHATSDPSKVQLYRPPRERGIRFEYDSAGYRSVPFDPEDGDPAPHPSEKEQPWPSVAS